MVSLNGGEYRGGGGVVTSGVNDVELDRWWWRVDRNDDGTNIEVVGSEREERAMVCRMATVIVDGCIRGMCSGELVGQSWRTWRPCERKNEGEDYSGIH